MNLVQQTFETLHLSYWVEQLRPNKSISKQGKIDFFVPLRRWLNGIEVENSTFAHRICKLIPSQCPFEREVKVLGWTVVKIPPMCKLNPVYDEVTALRFRAICYLADTCGEDISVYC